MPDARAVACDVTDPGSLGDALAQVARDVGPVEILVNNAGLFELGPAVETSPARFDAALSANLGAPFHLVRACLPAMLEAGRGHIVTLGSIADRAIFPGNAAYAAAKHGLRALHEVIRLETRGTGVRLTLVSPGPVDTPLWDPLDPDARDDLPSRADMLRADDVADAVLWAVTRPAHVDVEELRLGRS